MNASANANQTGRALILPPAYVFWIIFAVVLGLGNLLLNFHIAVGSLFPFLFVLGAALPTVSVIAWTTRALGANISWRQAALAFVIGGTLSVIVALVLETILPLLLYVLAPPFHFLPTSREALASPDLFARLLLSPLLIVFFVITAIQAPIPEEFAKALALPLLGRARITNERQALLIGLISGAGFAIMENMLYEGVYAQFNGWSWGGVTLLRGIGAVMHPLCAGLVALGWFRARAGGAGKIFRAYASAVGLHTLWNGGFAAFVYLTGLNYFSGAQLSLDVYGTATQILLVAFLVALALGLWWLLYRVVHSLRRDLQPEFAPTIVSARGLGVVAFASVAIIVPIGAALGQIIGIH